MSDLSNKLFVTVSGEEWIIDYLDYDLTFDSTQNEILERIRSSVLENFNKDLYDEDLGWLYKVEKVVSSKNIFLYPNSTAG